MPRLRLVCLAVIAAILLVGAAAIVNTYRPHFVWPGGAQEQR